MKPIWDRAAEGTISVFSALIVLAVFWVVASLTGRLFGRIANRAGGSRRDVILLGGQTAKVGILSVGAISALGTAGVNVSALVASLGLTGFALGFAFKDALSNLLAGAMILFYRPFCNGDRIVVTNYEGVVAGIDFRYTTLENDGKKFLIPNAFLLANIITVCPPSRNA